VIDPGRTFVAGRRNLSGSPAVLCAEGLGKLDVGYRVKGSPT
jgi:hypothetical protein